MAEPLKTTIDQALAQIKEWLASGDREKAKQGLKEILEFAPDNPDAKNMLAEAEKDTAGSPVTPTPAAPSPAPKPAETMPAAPSVQAVSAAAPEASAQQTPPSTSTPTTPASIADSSPEDKKRKLKLMAIGALVIVAVAAGFIFYKVVLGQKNTPDIEKQLESLQNANTNNETAAAKQEQPDSKSPSDEIASENATVSEKDSSESFSSLETSDYAKTPPASVEIEAETEKVKRR